MRVRSIAIASLVVATGCRQVFGLDETLPIDARVFDGVVDGDHLDAPAGCLGEGHFIVCAMPAAVDRVLSNVQISTEVDSTDCAPQQPTGWVEQGQPEACFVIASAMTIQNVTASGARPLVLVANTIEIGGRLSAAGRRGLVLPPAGFDKTRCAAFERAPASNGTSGGGGAGGTTDPDHPGGDGGDAGMVGALGGLHGTPVRPIVLHGGCLGQMGADGDQPAAGAAGVGGGAIYLVARSQVRCDPAGAIDVSGSSGGGGGQHSGAGGAGSGGMIAMWAPHLELASGCSVMANAGGGGAGGSSSGSGTTDGSEAVTPLAAAAGGSGGGGGGDGGNGFALATEAVKGHAGNPGQTGGGGAGGGAGIIYTNLPLGSTAAISPTPDAMP